MAKPLPEENRPKLTKEQFYKLTKEELIADWKRGLYPAHTYLHHIIKVLRRDGWSLSIDSVSDFCMQWGIPRSSFYRAKAKLIDLEVLQEEITGKIDLTLVKPMSVLETSVSEVEQCLESETVVPELRFPVPQVRHGPP